jgi:type II secretory pathway component PulK
MDNVPIKDAAGNVYGSFSIKITDMERKININSASDILIEHALSAIGVDASESSIVVDGIMDWIDPNPNSNVRRPNGAKSDYYQSLTPAYYAKNGPIDELSELLLIRGISQDIFWGAVSTNHTGAFFQKRDRFGRVIEQPMYSAGLVDIFTAIGGKVNVNTASATVLQAIPGIDENSAEQIVSMRAQEPFRNIGELINAGVNPGLIGVIGQNCDVHSRTFEVEVQAEVGGTKGTFYAIIARTGPKNFQTLSFYWK